VCNGKDASPDEDDSSDQSGDGPTPRFLHVPIKEVTPERVEVTPLEGHDE